MYRPNEKIQDWKFLILYRRTGINKYPVNK